MQEARGHDAHMRFKLGKGPQKVHCLAWFKECVVLRLPTTAAKCLADTKPEAFQQNEFVGNPLGRAEPPSSTTGARLDPGSWEPRLELVQSHGGGPRVRAVMARKIFVGSLPQGITEDELRREFETFGEVEEVFIKEMAASIASIASIALPHFALPHCHPQDPSRLPSTLAHPEGIPFQLWK
eukprot:Skav223342  [mRNA]  locus=scaffold200:294582:295319:+ [translate_table: standard]